MTPRPICPVASKILSIRQSAMPRPSLLRPKTGSVMTRLRGVGSVVRASTTGSSFDSGKFGAKYQKAEIRCYSIMENRWDIIFYVARRDHVAQFYDATDSVNWLFQEKGDISLPQNAFI
jgi:hypothetical protein